MPEYHESYDDNSRAAQRAVAAARLREQQSWLDLQAKRAVERGEHGVPPGPGTEQDPEWWAARLAERDRDAVLPPRLVILRENADLDDRLDRLDAEADVRREVVDFNERLNRARDEAPDGPPPRDVDATVEAWQERRAAPHVPRSEPAAHAKRRPWWNRH
jgi:hypothetical protein